MYLLQHCFCIRNALTVYALSNWPLSKLSGTIEILVDCIPLTSLPILALFSSPLPDAIVMLRRLELHDVLNLVLSLSLVSRFRLVLSLESFEQSPEIFVEPFKDFIQGLESLVTGLANKGSERISLLVSQWLCKTLKLGWSTRCSVEAILARSRSNTWDWVGAKVAFRFKFRIQTNFLIQPRTSEYVIATLKL